jgi:hypothetical protein
VLCQFQPLLVLYVGVSTLKVNGETIENSKGKAEALNEQFKSVFTKEDLDNFQQIDDSGTPDILNIPTKLMTNMTCSMILQGTDVNDTGR